MGEPRSEVARPDDLHAFRAAIEILPLVDLSIRGAGNDREAKLGRGFAIRGAAIEYVDPKTFRRKFVDGLANDDGGTEAPDATDASSYAFFEPDNWVLRLHTEDGRGKDSTWDLRLVTDHTNLSSTRAHRSTLVIDQCAGIQTQAWFQSLAWPVDVGGAFEDLELAFTPGGVPARIMLDEGLNFTQGGLALNVASNAGYVTDGAGIGQWDHLLTLFSGGGVGQTATGGGPCAPTSQKTAMLRGDVKILFGATPAHLTLQGEKPDQDVDSGPIYKVGMLIDQGDAVPPGQTLQRDPSSTLATLAKAESKGLVWSVRLRPTY